MTQVKETIISFVHEMSEESAQELLEYIESKMKPTKETLAAMEETKELSKNGNGYNSINELKKALES